MHAAGTNCGYRGRYAGGYSRFTFRSNIPYAVQRKRMLCAYIHLYLKKQGISFQCTAYGIFERSVNPLYRWRYAGGTAGGIVDTAGGSKYLRSGRG